MIISGGIGWRNKQRRLDHLGQFEHVHSLEDRETSQGKHDDLAFEAAITVTAHIEEWYQDEALGMPIEPNLTEVCALEERAFNVWPALRTVFVRGWVFRLADGFTKRANSANALAPSASFDGVRQAAETLYVGHGLRTIFRLSPLAPAEADVELEAAGYVRFDPSLVLVASLAANQDVSAARIDPSPSQSWLAGFASANGVSAAHRPIHDAMIASIALPCAFATVLCEGEAVAFGLGVLERSAVGLFDIVVHPDERGRGHGRAITRSLMAWGARAGADRAYLQVREENAAARRLYAFLGFEESYRYHYRLQPVRESRVRWPVHPRMICRRPAP